MNKVILIGNLGTDAELKVLANGDGLLKFSLATSEKWKDKATGEAKEKTEWHRCVLFGKRAIGLAPHLVKGTKIALEGGLQYGSYEKDGVKHYTTDIKVDNVEFAGGAKGDRAPAPSRADDSQAAGDEEIPF